MSDLGDGWQFFTYVDSAQLNITQYGTYTLALGLRRTTGYRHPVSVPVRMIPDDAKEALLLWLTTGGPPEPPIEEERQ